MATLTTVQKLKALLAADLEHCNDWEAEFLTSLGETLEDLEELGEAEPEYTDAQIKKIDEIYEKNEDWI